MLRPRHALALLALTTTLATASATAQTPAPATSAPAVGPGSWELRLGLGSTLAIGGLVVPGSQSGLGVLIVGSGNRSETNTLFGLNLGLSRFFNRNIALGALLDVNVVDIANTTIASVGFSPMVRGLLWLSSRANAFGELHVGYNGLFLSGSSKASHWLRVGVNVGFEYLIGASWGLRLWSGFSGLVAVGSSNANVYEVPLRWGFGGYF